MFQSCGRKVLVVAALSLLGSALPARATAPIEVQEGENHVHFDPIRRQGTYVRYVFVRNVPRERILAALPGPATGPDGFAPKMVTATPVERQFSKADGTVRAEKMRLPGLPEAMGATVFGRPTPDGMAFTMRDGLTTGGFTLTVGPARRLSDGDSEVLVTEAGNFSVMREPPKSLLGLPAYMASNWTPMGWFMQAAGGAAVSKAHVYLFELEKVLQHRLQAQ